MMTFTFRNEVLGPFWSSMLMLPRDEMLNATGISNFEAKYQAEHERVRQWLEENDML